MIDAVRLRNLLDYDPATGIFRWRADGIKTVRGAIAGGNRGHCGYRKIKIGGSCGGRYYAHRLAWLFVYGKWPRSQLDHINGVRDDNRICNLREATQTQNTRNARKRKSNRSGFKGVHWSKKARKWVSQISVNSHTRHLGSFDTPEDAHTAYCKAAQRFHGEFARIG